MQNWETKGSTIKHLFHCFLYVVVVLIVEILYGGIRIGDYKPIDFDPFERYGTIGASVLYLLRFLPLLVLPQTLATCLGLVMYNAFPDKVSLKESPLLAPFICVRIVTRGDFPDLVRHNVLQNLKVCLDVGLKNFMVEVVTDNPISNMPEHAHVRQVVVPSTYRTKSGALFKARALQYCLEDGVNVLSDNDWIVHLDEESIMTDNAVRGVVNFVMDGKYQFGQGLVTYANQEIVNWLTTLADSFRVADDMGKLRFQLRILHKPIFGWKGSYVVSNAGVERKVTYDHGLDGSVAEDCYFAMMAASQGFLFNFVNGEIWEKSPFTIWDFLQQRKRWMQGIFLVVHSAKVPIRTKVFLSMSFYAWVTVPIGTVNAVVAVLYPVPCWRLLDVVTLFIFGTIIYMYIYGFVKSVRLIHYGIFKFVLCLLGAILAVPFNILIENVAIIWALIGKKHRFYVVAKEYKPLVTV